MIYAAGNLLINIATYEIDSITPQKVIIYVFDVYLR